MLAFPGSTRNSLLDFSAVSPRYSGARASRMSTVVVLRTAPNVIGEELANCCSPLQVTEGLLLSHKPEILSFPLFLAEQFTGREGRRKGLLNVYRSHITQEAVHIL